MFLNPQPKQQIGKMKIALIILLAVFTVIGSITGCMYAYPKYRVYSQTMRGQADFKEAEVNRQITVEEARADEEALQMRAKGEAEREKIKADATTYATKKIGKELQSSPAYLRWLWINEVAGGEGERIYIPTEAGMPILEAGR